MTATRRFALYATVLTLGFLISFVTISYLDIDKSLYWILVFLHMLVFGLFAYFLYRKTIRDLDIEGRLENERLKKASYPHVIPELRDVHLIMDVPYSVVQINFEHRAGIDFTLKDIRPNDDIEYEVAMHSVANEMLKYRKPHFRDKWTEEDIDNLWNSTRSLTGYIPIINPPKLRNYLALLQINIPFKKIDITHPDYKLYQRPRTNSFPCINFQLKMDEENEPLHENYLPSGIDARRILSYFHSEINKHIKYTGQDWKVPKNMPENPKIYLGKSITDFIKALGLVTKPNAKTGQIGGDAKNSYRQIRSQLSALFSIQFRVIEDINYSTTLVDISGQKVNFFREGFFKDSKPAADLPYINLIDEYVNWKDAEDGRAYVRLNDEVYRSMVESPLAMDFDRFNKLEKNTLAADIYVSLCQILHHIETGKVDYDPIENLLLAFGSNYAKEGHSKYYKNLELIDKSGI